MRQLELRRLAPTPDNYARIYAEVSGGAAHSPAAALEAGTLAHAPQEVPVSGLALAEQGKAGGQHAWNDLVRDLLRCWDMRSPGWTQAQKRESFERLLAEAGNDSHRLAVRMASLLRTWSDGSVAPDQAATAATAPAGGVTFAPPALTGAAPATSNLHYEQMRDFVCELLRFLEDDSAQSGPDPSGLGVDAAQLSDEVEAARDLASLASLAPRLRALVPRLELAGRSRRELFHGLRGLLAMVVNNIEQMVPDERWIVGQLALLRDTLGEPLSPGNLTKADAALRSVISRQGTIKKGLVEAHDSMKLLLADFIARMGTMCSRPNWNTSPTWCAPTRSPECSTAAA